MAKKKTVVKKKKQVSCKKEKVTIEKGMKCLACKKRFTEQSNEHLFICPGCRAVHYVQVRKEGQPVRIRKRNPTYGYAL